VFGFLLWIPFLLRLMALYMAAIVTSTLTGGNDQAASAGLERGMSFYTDGFTRIGRVLGGGRPIWLPPLPSQRTGHLFWIVLGHLVWTVLFWFTVAGIVLWKLEWVPGWLRPLLTLSWYSG
jgi:hypothetical protein